MIRKIQILLAACMAVMLMTACGEEDETLGTEYQDPTVNFIPDPSATDATSVLRREFKEQYGSYLLFPDTLQHYQIGIDVNGDPKFFTEMLNILYSHISRSRFCSFKFNFIKISFKPFNTGSSTRIFYKRAICIYLIFF